MSLAVLRLQVRLNLPALGLLYNVKRAAVFADVFADLEAQGFAGAQRAASGEERVKHPVLAMGIVNDV
jgi:hypothetical protein